jgi:hypothetical protein
MVTAPWFSSKNAHEEFRYGLIDSGNSSVEGVPYLQRGTLPSERMTSGKTGFPKPSPLVAAKAVE